jgi:formyltetrahydrofolate-dependent phosphoribosylglycinamide formyltransferase
MTLLVIDQRWVWIVLYILLVVVLWPVAVVIVSLLTGQFKFFTSYIKRIAIRLGLFRKAGSAGSRQIHLAVFASGAGSNAQKIINHFRQHPIIRVGLIVCNNPGAGVLGIASRESIPGLLIDKEKFFRGDAYLPELRQRGIDFIVLAGFLWKLPNSLVAAFRHRIVNIHPALLPKFGGKGMYGNNVHTAVLAAGEKESGITIHYVDEVYDHGDIILQVKCPVLSGDTPEALAQRIHALEHEHYPPTIERLANAAGRGRES